MKVSFDRGNGTVEIRRFLFTSSVTHEEVMHAVTERFAVQKDSFKLQYYDDEDDLVEIGSDMELEAAVAAQHGETLRVLLSAVQESTFAQGPQIPRAIVLPEKENVLFEHGVEDAEANEQTVKDFELAKKIQEDEHDSSKSAGQAEQEASDFEFARKIHEMENGTSNKNMSVLGAAVLGAGVGLVAGGALMAVAGAGIGAVSASEVGRRKVQEAALSTGRAASDAGKRVAEATEQHRERVRATATVLASHAAEARVRADVAAREALARARELPVSGAVGRLSTAAGTALHRIRARCGIQQGGGSAAEQEGGEQGAAHHDS